jgi:hypothetical protein
MTMFQQPQRRRRRHGVVSAVGVCAALLVLWSGASSRQRRTQDSTSPENGRFWGGLFRHLAALSDEEIKATIFDRHDEPYEDKRATFSPAPTTAPAPISTSQPTLPVAGTSPPTFAAETVAEFLTRVLTDDGSLQITGTPQNRALQTFTTNNPGIILADSVETREFISTTYALSVLYFSTGGDQWLDRTGWIGAIPPCGNQVTATWFGVSCMDSKVQGIALANNDLVGRIPSEIRGLPSLQGLSLESNSLTSTIPVTLGQLSSLTSLDLSTNFLNGTIPTTINGATSLEVLSLSMNQISGSIPITVNQMTNLRQIALNDNLLEGTLPALTLPSLGKLYRVPTSCLVRSTRFSLTSLFFCQKC